MEFEQDLIEVCKMKGIIYVKHLFQIFSPGGVIQGGEAELIKGQLSII